jgi:hypothetical protein
MDLVEDAPAALPASVIDAVDVRVLLHAHEARQGIDRPGPGIRMHPVAGG